ncbi:chorion class B protein Ld34-like [Spodoptera litura]|uniref:Chorion class B protein Ld34-like n=1 Tax=Spodoptera litura TaxID=69820 RepID=A0A9J7IJH6_SPOLT|nr:chorion class B protein Ld34-like [Spodoptera litura]
MSVKAILVLCAQALLVKSTFGQVCGYAAPVVTSPCGLAAPGLAAPWAGLATPWTDLAAPYGLAGRGLGYEGIIGAPTMEFSPTSGGGLPVTSGSAIAPVGISVMSDNAYEGILQVIGELPFVGTVAMEGALPTVGGGAINHACGNGVNAMVSENAGFAPALGVAPYGSYGFPAGWANAVAPTPIGNPDLIGYRSGCGCANNFAYAI